MIKLAIKSKFWARWVGQYENAAQLRSQLKNTLHECHRLPYFSATTLSCRETQFGPHVRYPDIGDNNLQVRVDVRELKYPTTHKSVLVTEKERTMRHTATPRSFTVVAQPSKRMIDQVCNEISQQCTTTPQMKFETMGTDRAGREVIRQALLNNNYDILDTTQALSLNNVNTLPKDFRNKTTLRIDPMDVSCHWRWPKLAVPRQPGALNVLNNVVMMGHHNAPYYMQTFSAIFSKWRTNEIRMMVLPTSFPYGSELLSKIDHTDRGCMEEYPFLFNGDPGFALPTDVALNNLPVGIPLWVKRLKLDSWERVELRSVTQNTDSSSYTMVVHTVVRMPITLVSTDPFFEVRLVAPITMQCLNQLVAATSHHAPDGLSSVRCGSEEDRVTLEKGNILCFRRWLNPELCYTYDWHLQNAALTMRTGNPGDTGDTGDPGNHGNPGNIGNTGNPGNPGNTGNTTDHDNHDGHDDASASGLYTARPISTTHHTDVMIQLLQSFESHVLIHALPEQREAWDLAKQTDQGFDDCLRVVAIDVTLTLGSVPLSTTNTLKEFLTNDDTQASGTLHELLTTFLNIVGGRAKAPVIQLLCVPTKKYPSPVLGTGHLLNELPDRSTATSTGTNDTDGTDGTNTNSTNSAADDEQCSKLHSRAAEFIDLMIKQTAVEKDVLNVVHLMSRISIAPKAIAPGTQESNAEFMCRQLYSLFVLSCSSVPGPIVPCFKGTLFFHAKIQTTQQQLQHVQDDYKHYQGRCGARTQLEMKGHKWTTWPVWNMRIKHVKHEAAYGPHNSFGNKTIALQQFTGQSNETLRKPYDQTISSSPILATEEEWNAVKKYLGQSSVFDLRGTDKESRKDTTLTKFYATAGLLDTHYTIGQKQALVGFRSSDGTQQSRDEYPLYYTTNVPNGSIVLLLHRMNLCARVEHDGLLPGGGIVLGIYVFVQACACGVSQSFPKHPDSNGRYYDVLCTGSPKDMIVYTPVLSGSDDYVLEMFMNGSNEPIAQTDARPQRRHNQNNAHNGYPSHIVKDIEASLTAAVRFSECFSKGWGGVVFLFF